MIASIMFIQQHVVESSLIDFFIYVYVLCMKVVTSHWYPGSGMVLDFIDS